MEHLFHLCVVNNKKQSHCDHEKRSSHSLLLRFFYKTGEHLLYKHGLYPHLSNLYSAWYQPLMKESCRVAAHSHADDTLLGCGIAISTGKAEAGKWKAMVFIPRAQPLCRPVSLPTTLRGETEGILSFLPSIPVKSFIIQLPDYFKNLTRL